MKNLVRSGFVELIPHLHGHLGLELYRQIFIRRSGRVGPDWSQTVVRREIMTLARTGTWPNHNWLKTDWTLENQSPQKEISTQCASQSPGRVETISVKTRRCDRNQSLARIHGVVPIFPGPSSYQTSAGSLGRNIAFRYSGTHDVYRLSLDSSVGEIF